MPRFIEFYSLDVCQLIFLRQKSVPVSFIYWLYLCSFPLAIRRGLNKDASQSPLIAQTSSCGISQSESLVTVVAAIDLSRWWWASLYLLLNRCCMRCAIANVWHACCLAFSCAPLPQQCSQERVWFLSAMHLLPWHDCGEGAQPSCSTPQSMDQGISHGVTQASRTMTHSGLPLGPCDLPTSPSELQELNLHWLWARGNFQFSLNVHWWVKLLQLFNGQREPKHMNDMTFLIRTERFPPSIEHECWWCRAKCVSWLLSGCGSMKWLAFGGLCVLSFPLKMMHWQELLWESAESHTEWCASWFLGSASRTKKLWPAHGWLAFSEQTGRPIVAHCLCS